MKDMLAWTMMFTVIACLAIAGFQVDKYYTQHMAGTPAIEKRLAHLEAQALEQTTLNAALIDNMNKLVTLVTDQQANMTQAVALASNMLRATEINLFDTGVAQ